MEHLLLEPITIGPLRLPNRIVMPAMHLNYTMGGEITDQIIEFYRARARGGVGLIILGGCSIDPAGGGPYLVGMDDDRFIPGLARFVKETRIGETKLCAQLYHAGRYAFSMITRQQPIAPSPIAPQYYNRETPREMTLDDIVQVQQAYAQAARRGVQAGFDAIEVLASAGYLITQFLSPAANQRADEYGGSLKNRARFGCEVIRQVKEAIGPQTALLVRMAGADFVPGGMTNPEIAQAAKLFVAAGAQCINVTGGWHESRVPQITMSVPEGAYTYLAAGIKRAVDTPVIASNRLGDPYLAGQVLAKGEADLIAMGRPLIADPELPRKLQHGNVELIRPCIACNQGCFDHVFAGLPIQCMLNPQAGFEAEREIKPARRQKKIVIVGAGPGGVEAARVAAQRGHQVVLFEKSLHVGGALWQAAAAPGRQDFWRYIEFLEWELELAGVDVRLECEADLKMIKEEKPDLVIVATGAIPVTPGFVRQATHPHVVLAEDVLAGRAPVKGDSVIVGGGSVGAETALFIAHLDAIDPEVAAFLLIHDAETPERVKELLTTKHRKITICDLLPGIAKDLGRSTRWTVLQDMRRFGVEQYKNTEVVAINEQGVLVKADGREIMLPCQTVVVAVGYRSQNELAGKLAEAGLPYKTIGDAQAPRKVMEAVHEGFLAANEA